MDSLNPDFFSQAHQALDDPNAARPASLQDWLGNMAEIAKYAMMGRGMIKFPLSSNKINNTPAATAWRAKEQMTPHEMLQNLANEAGGSGGSMRPPSSPPLKPGTWGPDASRIEDLQSSLPKFGDASKGVDPAGGVRGVPNLNQPTWPQFQAFMEMLKRGMQ